MLKGKNIIIFSLMRFDALPSTNFTIAKYLAKENNVYYIENPFTFKEYFLLKKNDKKYQSRKAGFKFFSNGILERKIENINILISYPVLPINFLPRGKFYDFLLKINEKIIRYRIKKLIKNKQIEGYIYINFYNYNFPLLCETLNPLLKIYYCVDPIPDYYAKHGIDNELTLIKNSDIIICTSDELYRQKKNLHPKTYLVPNASDFVEYIDSNEIIPDKIFVNLSGPVIGYIGAIERRIDFDLLKYVIEENSSVNFVFIGPVYDGYVPNGFTQQRNVYFFPSVEYKRIPNIIAGFDVCIIPFKKDKISNTIFPLKLFEYLGMGKAVIVTMFNEDLLKYTGNTVQFVSDKYTFNNAIRFLLSTNRAADIANRIAIAKKNTWTVRFNSISQIILHNLNR